MGKETFKCSICDKEYQREDFYAKHMLGHCKQNENIVPTELPQFIMRYGRWKCVKCGRVLDNYLKNKHSC